MYYSLAIIHAKLLIALAFAILIGGRLANCSRGAEAAPPRLPVNAANQFGAVEASSLRWQHLSSRHGDLPVPGESTQQTGAITADLDQDGLTDFVLSFRQKAPALVWYRRTKSGWDRHVIDKDFLTVEAGGAVLDVDGDGLPDLVFGADWQGGDVWWWKNPGPPYDPNKPWKRYTIKRGGAHQHHDQIFGDFKGTGRQQLVYWNQGAKKLFIADIPAKPTEVAEWPATEVFSGAAGENPGKYAEGVAAADMDGDGRIDLLAGNYWFKYLGDNKFKSVRIGEIGGRIAAGQLMEGAKHPQVVIASGDGIGPLKWYECKGDPDKTADWVGHDLLGRDMIHGHSLQIADIDGDGHLDIFTAEMAKWTESRPDSDNPKAEALIFFGDGKGGFRKTVFATGIGFHEARVADLNGDGLMDILDKPYNWDAPRVDVWLQLPRDAKGSGKDTIRQRLESFFQPPAKFAGDFGPYRSPLKFADGTPVKTAADWQRRRQEVLALWHKRLGQWPPLVERPPVKRLETADRDGIAQHHVHVQISPDGKVADGYLLIPPGKGPFPAVLVPFYEPLTSIGKGEKGRGTHDYGIQLARRGFVTLSIGTPGSVEKIGEETRQLLTEAGKELRRQPLSILAYVAANCHTALAQTPEVDPQRIGIVGLSYGGKWSMFASCLYDKFACAVWSDPGIVFNEKDPNVNYWEPWYLGYDPKVQRKPGVPSADNPRTGLYKELIDAGDDLVDLHALMAPRPVLVSGGVQDPPENWRALNHLIAVNDLLGQKQRVAMTARPTHIPTAEALELELLFLEYWLKPRGDPADRSPGAPESSASRAALEDYHWTASKPLIAPLDRDGEHFFADKDPSFVQHDGRWHLFCTIRGQKRSHQIEYLSFADWEHVDGAERHILPLTDQYCCAPTVFYFRPQKKWYLISQFAEGPQDKERKPGFSTNADIARWQDWTKPAPLFDEPGQLVKGWIDFWVICDDKAAYLFFTSNDGQMWRSATKLGDFPHGWSQPVLALSGDIFEASHTYRLHDRQQYLTIVEAIGPNGRRYYKSYTADSLDGKWQPEDATWEHPFAGANIVAQPGGHWTDSISHGELFRLGIDERMEVDPTQLRLLFQGVSDEERAGKQYGQIPWRLGILDRAASK